MGNKNVRSSARSSSSSSSSNSSIARNLISSKSNNESETEALSTLLQLLLLSDIFDMESDDEEEGEDTDCENSEQNEEYLSLSEDIIESLEENVCENANKEVIQTMKAIRKRLNKANGKSFSEDIEKTVITRLVNYLNNENNSQLLFNALKTLRKISAKTKIRLSVLESSGLGLVVAQLLNNKHEDDSITFSALNVISNIASDGDDSKQYLLNCRVINSIIKCCKPSNSLLSKLRLDQASTSLLNLCSIENDSQDFNQLQPCIPCLVQLLEDQSSEETSSKAMIALSLIFCNTDEGKDYIINNGILEKMKQNFYTENECLLKSSFIGLLKICEKLLGEMHVFLDQNLIKHIKQLMTSVDSINIRTLINFRIGGIIQYCHIHSVDRVLDLFIDQQLCHSLSLVLRSDNDEYVVSGVGLIQCIFGGNYDRIREDFNDFFMTGEHPLLPQMIQTFHKYKDKNEELLIFLKAFSNMAADADYCRDKLLSFGLMDSCLDLITDTEYSCIQSKSLSVVKQLCGFSMIPPEFQYINHCIPVIKALIKHPDPEVIGDAVRVIANISKIPNEGKEAIIDAELVPDLIELMIHEDSNISMTASAAIVHLSIGSSGPLRETLNMDPYPILLELLLSNDDMIVARVCLSLQIILIANIDHIQEAIDSNITSVLISLMNSEHLFVKIRAMNTISQAISVSTPSQVSRFVDDGIIPTLSAISFIEEEDDAIKLLQSFQTILRVGEIFSEDSTDSQNIYALMIAESGGLESILNQRWRENQAISKIASEIISRYYPELDSDNYKAVVNNDKPNNTTLVNDMEDENKCKICFSRDQECLFLPCKHVVTCLKCNNEMIKNLSDGELHKCPICRTNIAQVIEMIKV